MILSAHLFGLVKENRQEILQVRGRERGCDDLLLRPVSRTLGGKHSIANQPSDNATRLPWFLVLVRVIQYIG